jgi:hypothetical protein
MMKTSSNQYRAFDPIDSAHGNGPDGRNAAADHKRVTQPGNHIHIDDPDYQRVVEPVRPGFPGKMDRVCFGMMRGSGFPATAGRNGCPGGNVANRGSLPEGGGPR